MGDELVTIEQLPAVPTDWDFDESVARVRPMVYKWNNLTQEILAELYIARKALSHRGLPQAGRHTWDEYCEAIGMTRQGVNLWLDERFGKLFPKSLFASTTPEWLTPADIVGRAVAVLGAIDLDPCSDNHGSPNVAAAHHYTQEDDGLSQRWFGRVYMNPPYGHVIGAWVEKLIHDYEKRDIEQAIALVPARTDTSWFRAFRDYPICFVAGRLRFSEATVGAPFPSAVRYLGPNINAFCDQFAAVGDIYVRIDVSAD